MSGKSRVLFVNTHGFGRDGVMPFGLIEAANRLEADKRGIFYFQIEDEPLDNIAAVVLHLHWETNLLYIRPLVEHVRSQNPAAWVIAGGFLAARFHNEILQDGLADVCLIEHCETAFPSLVDAVILGRSMEWISEHISGVALATKTAQQNSHTSNPSNRRGSDPMTLDWFPELQKYLSFQDSFHAVDDFCREEVYYPGVTMRSCFGGLCDYCLISGNRSGPCDMSAHAWYSAEDLYDLFERIGAEWGGFTIFCDVSGLDFGDLAARVADRRYPFALNLVDVQHELDPHLIERIAQSFRSLNLRLHCFPKESYIGDRPITDRDFECGCVPAWVDLAERNAKITVKFWVRDANLAISPETEARYGDYTVAMDGWMNLPVPKPGATSYAEMRRKCEVYEERAANRRLILRIHGREPVPADRDVVVESHYLSRSYSVDRADGERLLTDPDAIFAHITALGAHRCTFGLPCEASGHGWKYYFDLFLIAPSDERFRVRHRRFTVTLSACSNEAYVTIVFGENIGTIEICRGDAITRDVLCFTVIDPYEQLAEDEFDRLQARLNEKRSSLQKPLTCAKRE